MYEFALEIVKGYLAINPLITELKSEAIKERHWMVIKQKMNSHWSQAELTLGQLWQVLPPTPPTRWPSPPLLVM